MTSNVVCFYGEMGAGKTILVQALARELGVKKRVISPTFILMRNYPLNFAFKILNFKLNVLWHVDLYRLDYPNQVKKLGLEEIMADRNNLVLIEWAEKLGGLLPKKRDEINLKITAETTRKITFK